MHLYLTLMCLLGGPPYSLLVPKSDVWKVVLLQILAFLGKFVSHQRAACIFNIKTKMLYYFSCLSFTSASWMYAFLNKGIKAIKVNDCLLANLTLKMDLHCRFKSAVNVIQTSQPAKK